MKLSIKIITLFPKFIGSYLPSFGILQKAEKGKLLDIKPVDLRQFGLDVRQTVDGRPYGGGVGMVLRPDVLHKAIQSAAKSKIKNLKSKIILLTPQGKKFDQKTAHRLSKFDQLIFVCGRYEGFDERVRSFVDEEMSIGDYVLMGGELPALVISEAVMRLRPGILGKIESTHNESFSPVTDFNGRQKQSLLEYPQYTKPEILRVKSKALRVKNLRVPKVLLSGNHQKVEEWRKKEAEKRTKKRRPDLLN